MKITCFIANAASTAQKPDESTNVLRLNLPPKSDVVDDGNPGVFADDARKSCLIEIQGLTDEQQAAFRGGRRVVVTIEPAS